jgi:glycogen debranching enzyme
MLSMALELATYNIVYEDIASKFFEHFIRIADSMNQRGGMGLWDEEDGFYYDLYRQGEMRIPLKTRSLVGLLSLIAVEILDERKINKLPGFAKRMNWFLKHRKDLEVVITYCRVKVEHGNRILAIPSKERLERMLKYLIDEDEFLSPFGVRSLSKVHAKNPFCIRLENEEHSIEYAPGESNSFLFGGNSNWRGPIWFPINFLIVEALERYHHYYGDELLVEFPKGSGKKVNLKVLANEISKRLSSLFLPNEQGMRPCHGQETRYRDDPHWKDYLLFHEYFHADLGKGLGASHQTGWTALIAKLLSERR